ncbi:MAG: hypothetical protein QNJ31_06440 [Candidatus Caenarcaniphilales bacterium]|nr:hypothetical protein [Candidatus Caenarcaniphilales bacterium]
MSIKTKYKNSLDDTQSEILSELLRITEEDEIFDCKKINSSKQRSLALDLYLSSIGELQSLTKDEEEKISEKISKGQFHESKRLVKANLNLVVELVEKYNLPDEAVLDLIHAGNIALKQSAKTFTNGKKANFRKFAKPKIQASIHKVLSKLAKCFKLSCFACLLLATFAKADSSVTPSIEAQTLQKPTFITTMDWKYIKLSTKRIANEYGIREERVIDFMNHKLNYKESFFSIESLRNQRRREFAEQGYPLANLNENLRVLGSTVEERVNKVNLWDVVDKEVNQFIEKRILSNHRWNVQTPSFLKKINDKVTNVQVNLPNELLTHSGNIIAQVWVDTGTGKNLFAVPIEFEAIEDEPIEIVFASTPNIN